MSKIFTNSELAEMERQKSGDRSDKYGLFHNRVRPKIRELLNVWFPKANELAELERKKR